MAGKGNLTAAVRKETNMLSLTLLPGEYLTIGEDVVLQYDYTTGERCRLAINAPREVTI